MATFDVSVVIPTFNRLWCLPRAVASCRGTDCQTQIIVVDDGSTDGTWEWLQAQPDVLALRQANQGQTWAVNRGTAEARGTYIRFLDSDDALAPGAIDEQLRVARATGANLVYGRVDEIDLRSDTVNQKPELGDWDDFMAVQLGEAEQSHYLGMLFERAFVSGVPRRPDYALRDDRMYLLEVALLDPVIARSNGCAGYWTKHDGQMHDRYRGLTTVAAIWQHLRIYKVVLAGLQLRGTLNERRRRAAAGVLWRLAHEAARFDPGEGARVAEWAASLDSRVVAGAGPLATLYRTVGFRPTESLLRIRRAMLAPFRRSASTHDWYAGVGGVPSTPAATSAGEDEGAAASSRPTQKTTATVKPAGLGQGLPG